MKAPDGQAFLDAVTHDLRAPIAAVRTMLSLLSQGYVGELQLPQAELVGRIESRLAALQALVDDAAEAGWLRQAVERFGGTLEVRTDQAAGTTITVRLPPE